MKSPPLTNAELAIMDLLWKTDRLTAREIREQLYPDTTKSQHGTVQRLLQRLIVKGYVKCDKTLHVHLFSAAISRKNYAGNQLEELASKLTGGSLTPLITHLVEKKKISHKEIQELREILDNIGGKKDN